MIRSKWFWSKSASEELLPNLVVVGKGLYYFAWLGDELTSIVPEGYGRDILAAFK